MSKTKIESAPESVIQLKQPMVRDFSTGGGHLPGDTLVEGDDKIVTKKWQGYPPENLNVVGKPMPAMPEVAIPRFTGKALYATRVLLPNLLMQKLLTCPHPHARIKSLDTSKAERMPGVAYILTYKNAPKTFPLSQELNFQGDTVAFVAAETEDLAEDAVAAIEVDYEVLPFASTLAQATVARCAGPSCAPRKRQSHSMPENDPHYDPDATWVSKHGDVEKGFQEADVIKEFTYSFAGATAVPMQPVSCVAKWDGDKLTFWGMGQGIYPLRAEIARALANRSNHDPLHQQIERLHVRVGAVGVANTAVYRLSGKNGRQAGEGGADKKPGIGVHQHQAGDHHEIQSGRDERRPNRCPAARDSYQRGRGGRRRPLIVGAFEKPTRTLHRQGAELEIHLVQL